MDDADRAQKAEEGRREDALKKRMPELIAVGFCHNCGEALRPGLLFCDADCRDDYEKRSKLKQDNGG